MVTVATNAQDYNRFYNYAYDEIYNGSTCIQSGYGRQDYYQCGWYSCPPPPSSGGGGFCDGAPCPPGCTPKDNWCSGNSPIILDVDGKGFSLTNAAGGVVFDISGTGHPIQMGWTAQGADNAFLCLPDSNGKCDDGKDLFGNYTPQPHSANPNGFAALAVYDDPKNGGNGNGMIDPGDAIYSSLRLWIDANHDGISQQEEMHTLASLGVTSISLNYRLSAKEDQYGNIFRYRAEVDPNSADPDHVGRAAYDVFFVDLAPSSETLAENTTPPAGAKCPAPIKVKGGMLSTPGTLR